MNMICRIILKKKTQRSMNMICRIILKTSITSSNCNIEDLSMEMFEIIDKFAKKKDRNSNSAQ
jgi:hypothetical protein